MFPFSPCSQAGDGLWVGQQAKAQASSCSNSALSAAVAAVNILPLPISEGDADAASEHAIRAVLPLLSLASDSGRCNQVVLEGIKLLHAAAVKGELAEPGLHDKGARGTYIFVSEGGEGGMQGMRQQQSSKEAQQRQGSSKGKK